MSQSSLKTSKRYGCASLEGSKCAKLRTIPRDKAKQEYRRIDFLPTSNDGLGKELHRSWSSYSGPASRSQPNSLEKIDHKGLIAFPAQHLVAALDPRSTDKYARVARSSSRSNIQRRQWDVVSNERRFRYFCEWMRVKKLTHERRLRVASWNVGFLTGRQAELIETMTRRRVNILCLPETKWAGEKARIIESLNYKL